MMNVKSSKNFFISRSRLFKVENRTCLSTKQIKNCIYPAPSAFKLLNLNLL
jgi:hypothetical protein